VIDFNRDLTELAEKKNRRRRSGQGWMTVGTRLGLAQTALYDVCSVGR
jgi:hypothetical protein